MQYNRSAIYSLIFATITVAGFCIGLLPIPFSAVVCYPVAVLTSLVALFTGWRALRQTRADGGRGKWMAITGLAVGGATLLAIVCFSLFMAALYPYVQAFIEQMLGK